VSHAEHRFTSMGSGARIQLESPTLSSGALERHVAEIRALLEVVERTLSRFDPRSELSVCNDDRRAEVPCSSLMRRFAEAVAEAGARSGGLVDATLLGPLERQGYTASRAGVAAASLEEALVVAPPRRAARPHPARAWARVGAGEGTLVRPPGVRLDSGGLGKGLAADMAAALLPAGVRFAISCGGDLAVGAAPDRPWDVAVHDARTGEKVHRLRVRAGGVATSGIPARLWQRNDGGFAHHLLDPSTGEPAWSGLVAATAVAPTALDAEVLAKTAVLSGAAAARRLLARRGGVLQHDDGRIELVAGPPVAHLARPRPRVAA
jgi:thiamine biosynthesis lipoprotein